MACGASVVHFGITREDQLDPLLELLREKLGDIDKKNKGGAQALQRAPSTIAAALKTAKAALDEKVATPHYPKGGFTDVGIHGGGCPRDTAWPLVREVFQVSSVLFCFVASNLRRMFGISAYDYESCMCCDRFVGGI